MGPCLRYALESTSMGTKSSPNHRRFPGSLMMARLIGHTNEGSKAHTISRFENPFPSLPASQCCRTSENPWPAPKWRLSWKNPSWITWTSTKQHIRKNETHIGSIRSKLHQKKTKRFCKKKRHLAPAPINICWPSALLAGADNRNEAAPNPGREKEMKTKRNVTSKKLTYPTEREKDNHLQECRQGCGYQLDNCNQITLNNQFCWWFRNPAITSWGW